MLAYSRAPSSASEDQESEKRAAGRIVELAAIAHRHRECGWDVVAAMPRVVALSGLARKEISRAAIIVGDTYDETLKRCWEAAERKSRKVRYETACHVRAALS